jgi:hypothetical protein
MTRSIWQFLRTALIVAAFAVPAHAQETTGTIQGTVKDSTGAVLPGVAVTAKQLETGRKTDVVTNEVGQYTIPLLQPGPYEVTFALQAFQPSTIKGIQLHVNDRLQVDGKLGVGGTSETVQVSASSQFIQPNPAVQTLIGSTQVQELPLNNRNFVQLATLVPGVSSDLSDEVGVGLTSTVSISVNGGRRNAVNWLIDGVSNVDVGSNITLLATPTLESIQEFKIITSSYAAEWPRSGGGIVNVITRGGSQKFSGTAYEFFRNDALNANAFFRNKSTDAALNSKPAQLRYNNFGYSAGGPILPSRQKAFFFFSEEWRKISRVPISSTATVVNPAWLTDPTNANYVAPELRDPLSVKLLQLWPAPNLGVNQFINTKPNVNNTRQEVIRVDYDLNQRWKFVSRYTHDFSFTREPGGLFSFGIAVPNVASTDTSVPGHIWSNELRGTMRGGLNELKYQLSGNHISTADTEGNVNQLSQLGISVKELYPENNAGRIPGISTGGAISTINSLQGYNIIYWNHTITDNYTLQKGTHGFKAGALATFEQKNENASNNTHGTYTFATGGGRTAFQNFMLGNRDTLCGTTCSYSEAEIDVTNHLRFNRYEMFAQDSWRLRSNVTLDYGVRYALYPALTDTNDVLSTFDPAHWDPSKAPAFSTAAGTALLVGSGDFLNGLLISGKNSPFGRSIYKTDKNNFMPRVGLSWDPKQDGRMIVRAGYGLYYDQPLVGIFEQNTQVNPPFVNTVSVQNPILGNPGVGIAPGTTALRALQATALNFDTPQTQQWNIGVQRQLYRHGFIDVGYVGSRGDNLIQPLDINQPQPQDVVNNGGNVNPSRPYKGYTSITMRQTTAYSRYWGMLMQFRHEQGRNGSLTLNYTLSRNQTTATNDRDSIDFPQNPLNLDVEYADARTDRRHIFSANYIYELPFFRTSDKAFLKAALGGWQASGITNIASGAPVPRITANVNGSRRGGRANMVGDPKAGQMDFPYWFDPAAFAPPADGTYGD